MLQDYFMFHLNKARYELIEEGKKYYGETPNLKGVWATGGTLEECRQNLLSSIEGWVIIRLQKLRKLGFFGPYQAGKHPYMIKNDIVLTIPNPHEGDVSADLLVRILRQGNIKKDDWKNI